MSTLFRVALATAPFPHSVDAASEGVETFTRQAAERGGKIVCFPESYVPGMRGIDEPVAPHSAPALDRARARARALAADCGIAIVLPMDWAGGGGIQNVAMVIGERGELLGCQTKNQLDLCEDDIFVPGHGREVFEVAGVTFGISICHEAFRYPESVRWAARRGAAIVFQPHCLGSNKSGRRPTEWRGAGGTYHEHAIVCRAIENDIFFAGVNYAFTFQDSASCVIAPDGTCLAHQPYGTPGLLVVDIDPAHATRRLAMRYNPNAYVARD